MIEDIDVIASELKIIGSNVPVLWKPLHEATGGWFWWSAQGSQARKQLWDLMYNRLVNIHELNNLI